MPAPITDRRALRVLATALSWLLPSLLLLGYSVKLWRRAAPAWSSAKAAHHVAVRFAQDPSAPPEEPCGLSAQVQRELAAQVPLGRRLLDALHPFSWLARG